MVSIIVTCCLTTCFKGNLLPERCCIWAIQQKVVLFVLMSNCRVKSENLLLDLFEVSQMVELILMVLTIKSRKVTAVT